MSPSASEIFPLCFKFLHRTAHSPQNIKKSPSPKNKNLKPPAMNCCRLLIFGFPKSSIILRKFKTYCHDATPPLKCTPGSVRGVPGNRHSYRDPIHEKASFYHFTITWNFDSSGRDGPNCRKDQGL